MKTPRRQAFTLLELLTVLAITAVLMTLIIIPVVQSFNLMRAGQAFGDAQAKATSLVERISREINNAAAVRDNSGVRGTVSVRLPVLGANLNAGDFLNPGSPNWVNVPLPYSKIDLLKPAMGEPIRGPGGGLINPITGKEDPTLRAPKGQIVLPVSQGSTLVRYFVSLRDPSQPYNEPYTGILMPRAGGRDNLYVLRRAEVQPWIYGDHDENPGTPPQYFVNNKLFFDLSRDNDPTTSGPWYDDPDFFNLAVPQPAYTITRSDDPTKAQMLQNWISRSTVVTEFSRYDMVQPVYDKRTFQAQYIGTTPRVFSLVQFRPTTISNEPAEMATAVRLSEEGEAMGKFGPDVFRTSKGAWSNLLARFWPNGWDSSSGNELIRRYSVLRTDPATPGLSVFSTDPQDGDDLTFGRELFDVDEYVRSVRDGLPYPFTRAVATADSRSAWLSNQTLRSAFTPFVPIPGAGKLIMSFPITEFGTSPVPASADTPFANLNVAHMNTGPALTPTNDTALGGNFFDPEYSPSNGGGPGYADENSGSKINKLFNKVWQDFPNLRPNIHRFVDLRVVRMRDGSNSPLHPDPSTGFARAKIVPGSEVIFGPDQNPGPNYGRMVRYTRTTRTPGPNQYRINYYDLTEPANYSDLDPSFNNPPPTYTPTSFVSAVIQPRYKAGYIQFNSDPNVPLPANDTSDAGVTALNEGNISIFYRFQMTGSGDTAAVDYDTGHLMQVQLTIKNYPQTTLPNAQQVTLKATATVRNVLR